MPRGDGTGPAGQGPMTGRGLGFCAGYDTPGFTKGPGMGWGGRGMAWGWGGRGGRGMAWGRGARWGVAPVTPAYPTWVPTQVPVQQPVDNVEFLKSQKNALEAQVTNLQVALEQLAKKIEELEEKKE
ncbi:MAG: DUF5320 domain-containing protein [Candidatus Hodarchaeota archaeon]